MAFAGHKSQPRPRSQQDEAFKSAYEHFRQTLSADEKLLYSPCASSSDFLDGVRKLHIFANKRRIKTFERIERISGKFEKYFKVVDIMVQSSPEYSALVWGALRFVLQLASNFSVFFDKLVENLHKLSQEVPQYQTINISSEREISDRVRACTERVYMDMFQFFREVTRIFTSGCRLRRTPVVIGDLLWRPFESRFGDILERIKAQRALIEFDLALANAQIVNSIREIQLRELQIEDAERQHVKAEREKAKEAAEQTRAALHSIGRHLEGSTLQRIKEWLSPPQYPEAYLRARAAHQDGTNTWILDYPRFRLWRDTDWSVRTPSSPNSMSENILWVNGNPGSGKTILASSVIEELETDLEVLGRNHQVYYYFFSHEDNGNLTSTSAYRSVLAQMLEANRSNAELVNKFQFVMSGQNSHGTLKASSRELLELFKLCAQDSDIFIILDGIDECSDNGLLTQNILSLSLNTSAKFLLFGRSNTGPLLRTVPQELQISLDRNLTAGDLQVYISAEVEALLAECLFPIDAEADELAEHLVKGADGMFLWAKVMVNYLRLPVHTVNARLEVVREVVFPEGLEKMYSRIVDRISQAGKSSCHLASRILDLVSHSLEPLTLKELNHALVFEEAASRGHQQSYFQNIAETVLVVCGGLIECCSEITGRDQKVRFIHRSVKDHFTQLILQTGDDQLSGSFISPEPVADLKHATLCLQLIQQHTPKHHPDPALGLDVDGYVVGEFATYASRNWLGHLARYFRSIRSEPLTRAPLVEKALSQCETTISTFLENSTAVKFWIHLFYTLSKCRHSECKQPSISSRLSDLATVIGDYRSSHPASTSPPLGLIEELQEFSEDIKRMTAAWDQQLWGSTRFLWDEITSFCHSRFLDGPKRAEVISMAPTAPSVSIDGLKRLCSMSRTTDDGATTAVLSIWGSERHWVANYELWTHIPTASKIADVNMALDHMDPDTCIGTPQHKAKDPIWLSIGNTLKTIIIQRKVFKFTLASNQSLPSVASAGIPIDFVETNERGLGSFCRFSSDDKLLFFSYSEESICFGIAMFEIVQDRRLSVELVNRQNLVYLGYSPIVQTIFHPSLNIATVCGRDWIAAWQFGSREMGFFLPGTSLTTLFWSDDEVVNPLFSSCGKFLVFQTRSNNAPTIVAIPEHFLASDRASASSLETAHPPEAQTPAVSRQSLSRTSGFSSEILSLRPGQSLGSGIVVMGKNGRPSNIISVSGKTQVVVTKTSLNPGDTKEELSIIALPMYKGVEDTVPTILAPEPGDTSVKIVVNKECGHIGSQYPLFIERDMSAVAHTTHYPEKSVEAAKNDRKDDLASLKTTSHETDDMSAETPSEEPQRKRQKRRKN